MNTHERNTVLIIEDEPICSMLLMTDMEMAGYKVISASDGIEGFKLLQINQGVIKVILIDRMMPNMNGIEFMKKFKQNLSFCHIPVIMQSASAYPFEIEEGIESGVYCYITKPYDHSYLLNMVKNAIESTEKHTVQTKLT